MFLLVALQPPNVSPSATYRPGQSSFFVTIERTGPGCSSSFLRDGVQSTVGSRVEIVCLKLRCGRQSVYLFLKSRVREIVEIEECENIDLMRPFL